MPDSNKSQQELNPEQQEKYEQLKIEFFEQLEKDEAKQLAFWDSVVTFLNASESEFPDREWFIEHYTSGEGPE